MVMVVTVLALLSQVRFASALYHTCIPNTKFALNGQLCNCNHNGSYTESDCIDLNRYANCTTGQVRRQGCSQCICQDNGQFVCSNADCYQVRRNLNNASNAWCQPFKSYYIDCSICVCPASGKTSESHCAIDNSCRLSPSSEFLHSVNKNACIPNVMYLYPCLHCLCSDSGKFILDKCMETCQRSHPTEITKRCIARTFYRKNCNVCWCPDSSIPDDQLCTNRPCKKISKFTDLDILRSSTTKCLPNSFLKPKCFYCDCNTRGQINKNACLALKCLKIKDFRYDVTKTTCSPGEMIPICIECFCPRNGMTNETYCTNVCSYQSKLNVIEKILQDNNADKPLVDIEDINTSDNEQCSPNTVYLEQGRYCLCPEEGRTNFNLCTVIEEATTTRSQMGVTIDAFNESCPPNTFVEINCNTCYCSKNGKIDFKWCTSDDCHAKKIIQDSHKSIKVSTFLTSECVPGSISKRDCNFCICPESGKCEEQACTKNKCSEIQKGLDDEKLFCEPLDYYLVDCNVCLCPGDGIKNIAKCTKKICEKSLLRSSSCVPGQIFIDDCNVCVCPPNGDKTDKACTNYKCSDSDSPWQEIFRLSQSLLDNRMSLDVKRQLDVCYSGEQFDTGCKTCVCSDVGLRSYATCSKSRCEEKNIKSSSLLSSRPEFLSSEQLILEPSEPEEGMRAEMDHTRSRRDDDSGMSCVTFNLTNNVPSKPCTPGSMYILRCRQCICPYAGNVNEFCRPLPAGTFCEQAYPGFNYISMGRRINEDNITTNHNKSTSFLPLNHNHTEYSCTEPGRVMDSCFVCECEATLVLIEEHCFKSVAKECEDAKPSFFDVNNKVVTA